MDQQRKRKKSFLLGLTKFQRADGANPDFDIRQVATKRAKTHAAIKEAT